MGDITLKWAINCPKCIAKKSGVSTPKQLLSIYMQDKNGSVKALMKLTPGKCDSNPSTFASKITSSKTRI